MFYMHKHTNRCTYRMTIREKLEHFLLRIPESTCWYFDGALSNGGYAQIKHNGRTPLVHKLAYETFVGPVPDGKVIDHKCRERSCFNPDHLEAVAPYENFLRGNAPAAKQLRQTHCKRGHLLGLPNAKGIRACKECNRDRCREWYKAQTA
jgi:hypothetical protein